MASQIITDNDLSRFLKTDHSIYYVTEIFKNVIDFDPAWMVEVRRIGEYRMDDGTTAPAEQTSAAQLLQFDQFNPIPDLSQWVAQRVIASAPIGIGTFMAPALLNDRRATDASVKQMLSVCADFDTGNPTEQLAAAIQRVGVRPTMIARSGGITAEGHYKLHAHWRLDEPCDEPWKIAYIREQLARAFGADQSFKRIPQIIRIPGALYDKHGKWSVTEIIEATNNDMGIMGWEEALEIDWDNLHVESMYHSRNVAKSKEERSDRLHALHTEEVSEGRTTDTRWDRFSEYAGHQIRQARFGHQSVEEAQESTAIWVRDKMVPPWDGQRIDAEFKALLQRDRVNHEAAWGEIGKPPITFNGMPAPFTAPQVAIAPATSQLPAAPQPDQTAAPAMGDWELDMFAANLLFAGEAPAERHLIENFLVHGSSAALVADGGVGKTYVSLELALRAAAGPVMFGNNPNRFMGFDVKERCNVIVFTVEDGQHDLHRRICAIDPDSSLREAAGNHCMIVPVQEQILDGLTLVEKDNKGNYGPSRAWKAMQEFIRKCIAKDFRKDHPLLVIIDTYSATHHGDENAATGTNEWFRAAGQLRQFEATLLVTHHVRKADPKMEIRTPSDMKAAVRGSSAFLNSVRLAFGIWEMPNGDSVLKELPREQNARVFNMGILKNNTGVSWEDRSDPRYPEPLITLSRSPFGRLYYDAMLHMKRIELSASKKERVGQARTQLRAAIVQAVRWYAKEGWPLTAANLTRQKDQFLPQPVNGMAIKTEIEPVIGKLISEGVIKQIKIKKTNGHVLDVADGPYSATLQDERKADVPAMQWAHFKYDEEHEEYIALHGVQHAMDF